MCMSLCRQIFSFTATKGKIPKYFLPVGNALHAVCKVKFLRTLGCTAVRHQLIVNYYKDLGAQSLVDWLVVRMH